MPLHPQVETFLAAAAANDAPGWNEFTPEAARTEFSSWKELFGTGPDLARVEDRVIGDNIPVRIYQTAVPQSQPTVMYFHGGGWVLGDLDSHDSLCRRLAAAAECTVISVHYRRAPEARWPAALDDCYLATKYVSENADELQVDSGPLIVAGDSAGGNLAATVCVKARDKTGPGINGQILIYPITGYDFDTQSYLDYAAGFGLTRDSMMWFWEQYMGQQPVDALAAPLLVESLRNLPRTHLLLAEYDVLRSEGESYASRLTEAGVAVSTRQYDGMLHGFVHFSGAFDVGREAITDIAAVVRSMA